MPRQSKFIAVDTETTGLDVAHGQCRPFAVFTCDDLGVKHSFVWEVNPYTRLPQFYGDDLEALYNLLLNRTIVFHNAKFDIQALNSIGFEWPRPATPSPISVPHPNDFHDTLLLSHVFHSSESHSLKDLASKYLKLDLKTGQTNLQKATVKARSLAKRLNIPLGEDVETDYWLPAEIARLAKDENSPTLTLTPVLASQFSNVLLQYGHADATATIQLFLMYQNLLSRKQDPATKDLARCYERELSLLPVILSLEHFGVSLVSDNLNPLIAEYQETVTVTTLKLRRLLRAPNFNPNSYAQIQAAYQSKGIQLPNTESKTLKTYLDHPVKAVRELTVLLLADKDANSGLKYVTQYKERAVTCKSPGIIPNKYPFKTTTIPTLRVHAHFRQTGPATTRLSCGRPNVQNVAGKDDSAKLPLRKAFGPAEGRLWYAFDYKQLQIRIFAYLAEDQAIISALEAGKDFHDIVARKLYQIPDDSAPTETQRRNAKAINFGLIFGMGRKKLAASTGQPELYDLFKSQFPSLAKTMANAQSQVRRLGYVTTPFGYRLYPYGGAAHTALNYIVQGGEGDIVKNAMIEVYDYLRSNGVVKPPAVPAFLTLTVHDELVIDCPFNWPLKHVTDIKDILVYHGKALGFDTPVSCSVIESDWFDPVKLNLQVSPSAD